MNNNILKLKLWRIENVILMKIFEQNTSLIKKMESFTASNGFIIKCISNPELDYSTIYLRGDEKYDQMIATYTCIDSFQAKEKIIAYKKALEEFCSYYENKINFKKTDYIISDIEEYIIGD